MFTETTLPKIVDRFDLGFRAKLTTAKKTFTCRVSGKLINPGEQYYSIVNQYGVTPWPVRVRPEYLNQYWEMWQIRRKANVH